MVLYIMCQGIFVVILSFGVDKLERMFFIYYLKWRVKGGW